MFSNRSVKCLQNPEPFPPAFPFVAKEKWQQIIGLAFSLKTQ